MIATITTITILYMGSYFCSLIEPPTDNSSSIVSDKTIPSNSSCNPPMKKHLAIQKRIDDIVLQPDKKLTIEDFILRKTIAEKRTSTLYIAELKDNIQKDLKKYFILKEIRKNKINYNYLIQNAQTQKKKINTHLQSNFILRFNFGFQDKSFCYFVAQYAMGGSMQTFIYNNNMSHYLKKLGEDAIKFIFACIVLGIQDVHKQNLIYKYLKPQNVLIFGNGYPKLADLGVFQATKSEQIIQNPIETKLYLAPQIIFKKELTNCVDFWTLGVFLHQLFFFAPPFDQNSVTSGKFTFSQIKIQNIQDNKDQNISVDGKNLIDSFLKLEPKQRLGYNGFQQIKKHKFFKGLDWQALSEMRIQSPLVYLVQQFSIFYGINSDHKQNKQFFTNTRNYMQVQTQIRVPKEDIIPV